MATTNYYSIRDQYATAIEALTPTTAGQLTFRRLRHGVSIADVLSSENAGSGMFRAFEIRRTAAGEEAELMDTSQVEMTEELTVFVAYPWLPGLYDAGSTDQQSDMDWMERIVEEDARSIRDALTSSANYVSGHNVTIVNSVEIEQVADNVWLLGIIAEIKYYASQSIS